MHDAYLAAGADCIATATYQASLPGFRAAGLSDEEGLALFARAIDLATGSRDRFAASRGDSGRTVPVVAASLGPYGAFLADGSEYDGRYGVEDDVLRGFHGERFRWFADSTAEVVAFETIPSLQETRVLTELIAESDAWSWISFSCSDGGHLNDGTPIEEAVVATDGAERLAAVGVNCTHPSHVEELVRRIAGCTDRPVIAYPNSGETWDGARKRWSGDPTADWTDGPEAWYRAGARVLGGCCRTGPELVRSLEERLPSD